MRDFDSGAYRKTIVLEDEERLFRSGQRCTQMYSVQAGAIRLERPSTSGITITMHRAGPGEWVAESSLYSERYHCDAVAEGDTIVAAIRKDELLRLFAADPQRHTLFSKMLASRLRELRSLHEIVRIRRADERILAWLRLNEAGDPPRVVLTRPWTRIAGELGLTHEALYRTLSKLRNAGVISMENHSVALRASQRRIRSGKRS